MTRMESLPDTKELKCRKNCENCWWWVKQYSALPHGQCTEPDYKYVASPTECDKAVKNTIIMTRPEFCCSLFMPRSGPPPVLQPTWIKTTKE